MVRVLAAALLTISTFGCGSGAVPVYQVTGKVTGGTASLKGVRVHFLPVEKDGLAAVGDIGDDGTYKLQSIDGRIGAAAGKYKVCLSLGPEAFKEAMKEMKIPAGGPAKKPMKPGGPASSSADMPKVKAPFPDSYLDASTSPKEVEVKSQQNILDIAI